MKISLLGIDDKLQQSIALVFKHRTENAVEITAEDSADITIIDLDQEDSLQCYRSALQRRPALKAIGFTAKPELAVDGIVILNKPMSANLLLDAVQKVSGNALPKTRMKVGSAASSLGKRIGTQKKVVETQVTKPAGSKLTDSKFTDSSISYFNPDDYLLGTIMRAVNESRQKDVVISISFYGDRVIVVDDSSKIIKTNLSSSQVRAFSVSAINEHGVESAMGGLGKPVVERLWRADAKTRFADITLSMPQEIFMWKLGANTSRGRLPENVNPDHLIELRRWPNLTRFNYSDDDMRIIAYWMRQPSCLRHLVESLGISEQLVFRMYTAAYAASLTHEPKPEAAATAVAVAEHRERGLLSSILKRLTQRKTAGQMQGAAA